MIGAKRKIENKKKAKSDRSSWMRERRGIECTSFSKYMRFSIISSREKSCMSSSTLDGRRGIPARGFCSSGASSVSPPPPPPPAVAAADDDASAVPAVPRDTDADVVTDGLNSRKVLPMEPKKDWFDALGTNAGLSDAA